MKLLFSEAKSDYGHYLFPYVVWAVPEAGEPPAALFAAGFLPAANRLDRFYLCRQVRVPLARFQPSSENRRILRKGAGIAVALVPRAGFAYTPAVRELCQRCADRRFGPEVMSSERLDALFDAPGLTHVLVFTDRHSGAQIGVATLYVEGAELAFYRFGFYDPDHGNRSLGLFMMTSALVLFAGLKCGHVYLGTCYSDRARYKTQFAGVEFFNGFRWSGNLAELKHLLRRDQQETGRHLLENAAFRKEFYALDLAEISAASKFRVQLG